MSDLYDRITADPETGVGKIAVHPFSAMLRELSRGAVTKAEVVSQFNLDSAQESELDSIISMYQAQSDQTAKDSYAVKIHDVFILSEESIYNKAKAKSELGF